MTKLAIKLDVDTLRGYIRGVPPLLDLFKKRGLRASIFFSFGPDNSGREIRRVLRPGFVSKMLRTKAPSTYGLRTLMYGTLMPAPLIVPAAPGIVRRAACEGHDVGVHAWDHVYVQDKLAKISKKEYLSLYGRARELYVKLCGREPRSIAAPAGRSLAPCWKPRKSWGFLTRATRADTPPSRPYSTKNATPYRRYRRRCRLWTKCSACLG